jgi:hypothetical protein
MTDFNTLVPDVNAHIQTFLSPSDLAHLSGVSRSNFNLSDDAKNEAYVQLGLGFPNNNNQKNLDEYNSQYLDVKKKRDEISDPIQVCHILLKLQQIQSFVLFNGEIDKLTSLSQEIQNIILLASEVDNVPHFDYRSQEINLTKLDLKIIYILFNLFPNLLYQDGIDNPEHAAIFMENDYLRNKLPWNSLLPRNNQNNILKILFWMGVNKVRKDLLRALSIPFNLPKEIMDDLAYTTQSFFMRCIIFVFLIIPVTTVFLIVSPIILPLLFFTLMIDSMIDLKYTYQNLSSPTIFDLSQQAERQQKKTQITILKQSLQPSDYEDKVAAPPPQDERMIDSNLTSNPLPVEPTTYRLR